MSGHFFVTGATCNLIVRPESFPAISIVIDGITDRMGVLPDAVKIAAFERSVESFVSQELPKFVQFGEGCGK